jgi:hypothetical protein
MVRQFSAGALACFQAIQTTRNVITMIRSYPRIGRAMLSTGMQLQIFDINLYDMENPIW